jgi:hypothetical protein
VAEQALPRRRFPVLFEVNARTWVGGLGAAATLADVNDSELDRLLPAGTDWLYLLGVWQTGPAGRAVSLSDPGIRADCEAALPGLTDDDICGSCFAVADYRVDDRLGGPDALAHLRGVLARRGVRLMLDFVPNHTAPDHRWVREHPGRYITGTAADLESAPDRWTLVTVDDDDRILAMGRDPFFAGWPDTLQLDYSSADLRTAMTAELCASSALCDGLRCDMAMLLLPDVFERTWGRTTEAFWPGALDAVRRDRPEFVFMAEVYWDREYDLQQEGFDFTYDKRLYDRLVGDVSGVRDHLSADPQFQARSARFLENHDEARAAEVFGVGDRHRAAAVVTYLCAGLRFFHDGQPDGHRIHVPVHLCRGPVEPDDRELAEFYATLFELLDDATLHDGQWQLLDSTAAWAENGTNADIVAFAWSDSADGDLRFIVCVNLSDHDSQAYIALPFEDLNGRSVTLQDRLGPERHVRDGDELRDHGLYLDLHPWAHHVFDVG